MMYRISFDDPAEDSGHMEQLESTARPSETLSEVLREEIDSNLIISITCSTNIMH